jgi:hypothetical protein
MNNISIQIESGNNLAYWVNKIANLMTEQAKTFLLVTLWLSVCSVSLSAQQNSFRSFVGWEVAGDYVFADATIGASFRHTLHNWLYVESFLRAGYGGLLTGESSPRYPENYIGKFRVFALEDDIAHDKIENGLANQRNEDSHLFTLIHGYQLGAQTSGEKFRAYTGAGVSIGYMDHQTIGEAGDAYFKYDGKEVLVWYSIPAYERGLGLQLSFSVGAERVWQKWFCGVRGDLDAGSFGVSALGTRMSIALVVGVPL